MGRAAQVCGERILADRLGVTSRQLELWMSGLGEPTADVFLKLADILDEQATEELKSQADRPPGTQDD